VLAERHPLPGGAERFYRDAITRLPYRFVCHDPPAVAPAPGARPPGPVVFGSFNALKKITPAAIEAWARILAAVPDSRLLVKATALACEATQRRFRQSFAGHGIGEERLVLQGGSSRAAHLEAMASADIVLDSFPYSGGVTTLECLWMGLPVITLPGESFASRHSAGYLATTGLTELVAESPDAYVALAAALAGDRARLAGLRSGMRSRLLASPLCDPGRFLGHFEEACRRAWASHLAGAPPHSFSVAS
jgi:protein O-GlcNAc transferase